MDVYGCLRRLLASCQNVVASVSDQASERRIQSADCVFISGVLAQRQKPALGSFSGLFLICSAAGASCSRTPSPLARGSAASAAALTSGLHTFTYFVVYLSIMFFIYSCFFIP